MPRGLTSAVLAHGRYLVDAVPEAHAFGPLWRWTIEDLDSDAEDQVVASGVAAPLGCVDLDVCTALLGPNGLMRQRA